jgi:hypothetical protein
MVYSLKTLQTAMDLLLQRLLTQLVRFLLVFSLLRHIALQKVKAYMQRLLQKTSSEIQQHQLLVMVELLF